MLRVLDPADSAVCNKLRSALLVRSLQAGSDSEPLVLPSERCGVGGVMVQWHVMCCWKTNCNMLLKTTPSSQCGHF